MIIKHYAKKICGQDVCTCLAHENDIEETSYTEREIEWDLDKVWFCGYCSSINIPKSNYCCTCGCKFKT